MIDTGDFEKLERFGRYVVRRPEPQAILAADAPEEWRRAADASFLRDTRSEARRVASRSRNAFALDGGLRL